MGPKPGDTCNYCKQKGHWKSDCPKKRQGQCGNASGTITVVEDGSRSEEDIAVVVDGHTHYTDVVGIGSINLRTHDGKFYTLNDVRHVPHMTKNLISLSLLDTKGFSFKGECGVLHVYNGSKVILKGVKRVASSEVDKEDMTKLWHMRLGHMSERGMQILAKDNLLGRHEIKDLGFYEHCVFGKLHRSKFPKTTHRINGTLDYIHVDCWGPSRVNSMGSHKYFLSLIDDYSRMTWVFIIK
ncbi:hypothetical protein LIER_16562 [Lithospermum erythrorhizon]|uniref:CCHC-type domain-containing protein n=1 Tax=Lithospermum erythrorhizon TaxID=34254 RepID=A0AAV3QCH4_LITER